MFRPQARGTAATEQALLWATAALLPPLLLFTIYFCCLHSLRHFSATIRSIPRAGRALAIAALLSGVVVLAAGSFLQTVANEGPDALARGLAQTIFIGLAALTVPHMILVDRYNKFRTGQALALQSHDG